MSQRAKLIEAIRRNPKDVRFDDACTVAELLGFVRRGTKSNHRVYTRTGERTGLNFQDRNGKIKPYQARQLIEMIDKYENEL
jgi:hypothetical protein